MTLILLTLFACGRESTDADVRLVGVGSHPDEIGPSPTPYGGYVEYAHVDLGGGGLSLAHMGLGSFAEIGPGFSDFAPPYAGVIGFSYLFDKRLPAADTMSFVAPVPPAVEDTCYTVFEPEGPIGSFTTLDVGDYLEFASEDGARGFRMGRVPADYPPDPQDLFIYYSSVEEFAPYSRTHRVPGETNDPRDMGEQIWKRANFPFEETLSFRFPGGLSRFDQPVGSIPRPSTAAAAPETAQIQLPSPLGGVMLSWADDVGAQSACFEFYGGRTPPVDRSECDTLAKVPTDNTYNKFPGQTYVGPWDAPDGVKIEWDAADKVGDQVTLTVRFMAPIDRNDPNYLVRTTDGRPALACEPGGEFVFDESLLDEDGELSPAMHGDPFSRMAEVTCLLADDGEFTLTEALVEDAYLYALARQAGGSIFLFSRGSETEVDVPAAKDQYDQRHDITPIKVTTRSTRVGRFGWATDGGDE